MQLLLPLIAIGILVIISFVGPKKNVVEKAKTTPTPSLSLGPTTTLTPTPTVKNSSSIVITLSPTKTTSSSDAYSQTFIYPGAKAISTSGKITLESTDSPNTITDWYKNKIKEQGMNTTSFVTTSTNGKMLNKLAGANSSKNVEVEIQKESNESTVHITVSF